MKAESVYNNYLKILKTQNGISFILKPLPPLKYITSSNIRLITRQFCLTDVELYLALV